MTCVETCFNQELRLVSKNQDITEIDNAADSSFHLKCSKAINFKTVLLRAHITLKFRNPIIAIIEISQCGDDIMLNTLHV